LERADLPLDAETNYTEVALLAFTLLLGSLFLLLLNTNLPKDGYSNYYRKVLAKSPVLIINFKVLYELLWT
jgi:hypothetical protein